MPIAPDSNSPNPVRILLAEDNVMNQRVALLMLQQIGYQADIASSGVEALQRLCQRAYDVILMDVHMPLMDGLEATRYIRQAWNDALSLSSMPLSRDAPRAAGVFLPEALLANLTLAVQASARSAPCIVAMTANVMQGDRENCIAAGMNDYLSKPIRLAELEAVLTRCQPMLACPAPAIVKPPQKAHPQTAHPPVGATVRPPVGASLTMAASSSSNYPRAPQRPAVALAVASPLDRQIIQSLRSMLGDQASAKLSCLIDCYLSEAPEYLQSLRWAAIRQDAVRLKQIAHTLKSSSHSLGALKLVRLCQALEELGQRGTLEAQADRLADLLEQVMVEFDRVRMALQQERQPS